MSDHPIVVLESDPSRRSSLTAAAGPSALSLASPGALAESITGPTVVVFGPSYADDEGMAALGDLLQSRPSTGAILVTPVLSTEVLQTALRAGFRDVLAEPVDDGSLGEAISRVSSTLAPATGTGAGLAAADGERGRLIVVFSTKGGAGKSMLTTNVATSIAQRDVGSVAIVDADLQFGDVSVMMKLAPRHTIVDAVANRDRLDSAFVESLLVTHGPTGLKVMPAPLEPALADQVTADDMIAVVDIMRATHDFVIVDTPAYFNDVVLALIEEADDVLLLAGMDIPNIKNVRIGLQTLRILETPMAKVKLVLNRANSKVKLDSSEVERTLQIEAYSRIPSDVAVPQSVNRGVPIVMDAPRSGPAKAIEALVKRLLEEGP